jgi:hypothetical protein
MPEHPKPVRWESEKYKAFIREKPCVFCLKPPPSEPHHIRDIVLSGTGTKPSDGLCVPACRNCHEDDQNNENWHRQYINIQREIILYLNEYLSTLKGA